MLGFFVALVWFLVALGSGGSLPSTVALISRILFWWYALTSIPVFFGIFSARDPAIARFVVERFVKPRGCPPDVVFAGTMFSFILSRVMFYYALSFLSAWASQAEALNGRFAGGAILFFLGASISICTMYPAMAKASLQRAAVAEMRRF